jgi:Sec-independent protein secretion pathway component TatC
MVRTKLSLILGIMTAFPYIGYRIWKFVMPGLFRNERGRVMPIVVWSISALLRRRGLLLFHGGAGHG